MNVSKRLHIPLKTGLFFSDVKVDVAHILINTVDKNKNIYTIKQYSDAHKALPNTADCISYEERDLIPNCPITKSDIIHARDILGQNLGSLNGKTMRKTPDRVLLYT